MDKKQYKVPLSSFLVLLQDVVNKKFDIQLQILKKKFASFFNIAKHIIFNLVKMHELVIYSNEVEFGNNHNFQHDEEWIDPKQLIHRSLHYLQLCFTEFPDYISLDYCEHFLRYTSERISQIKVNLLPLSNLTLETKSTRIHEDILRKINNYMKSIDEAIRLLSTILPEILNEKVKQTSILEQKQEIYNNFKSKIDSISNSYNELKTNLVFLPYHTIYKSFHRPQRKTSKNNSLSSLFIAITSAINLQLKLQRMLEGPTKLAQILNQVGKKSLRGQVLEVQQAMKYCLILNKPDQTISVINKDNLNEFIETIKFLDKQSFYLNLTSTDNLWFDGNQFKSDWIQWELLNSEIVTLCNKQSIIQEWNSERINNSLIVMDIDQFVSQLFDFQKHMVHYFQLCVKFEMVNKEIELEFVSKFNITIGIDCPDLNHQ